MTSWKMTVIQFTKLEIKITHAVKKKLRDLAMKSTQKTIDDNNDKQNERKGVTTELINY